MAVRADRRALTARAAAIELARAIARDSATIYLDTETTGLGEWDEIVEIAVIDGRGAVLFDTLVRPDGHIPATATAIHGITDGDVRQAPAWLAVYPELDRMLRGQRVVVFNAAYDRRLIVQSCANAGLAPPNWRWECAMRLYARYRAEPGRHGQYRWHSLEQAAVACKVPAGGHRARADALACRAVVAALAAG